MAVIPPTNLPPDAQPWGRYVSGNIVDLSLSAAMMRQDIDNNQKFAAAQFNRMQQQVSQINTAATNALNAASVANAAAVTAGNVATTANNAASQAQSAATQAGTAATTANNAATQANTAVSRLNQNTATNYTTSGVQATTSLSDGTNTIISFSFAKPSWATSFTSFVTSTSRTQTQNFNINGAFNGQMVTTVNGAQSNANDVGTKFSDVYTVTVQPFTVTAGTSGNVTCTLQYLNVSNRNAQSNYICYMGALVIWYA